MASKLTIAASATVQKLRYKAKFNVLSDQELHAVDRIFDATYTDATRNMYSYPRKLLHLPRRFGGLGVAQFSALVEVGKLQKLFSCLRSTQLFSQAALGLLSRVARKHGHSTMPGYPLVLLPLTNPITSRKLYLDGPVE